MRLKKELGFMGLFSVATGAMISSGIFILPGLAFGKTGPSVFVAYLLAGILAFFGILSIIELSTAMPKAGGDYFFVTRSLGPLIGTIHGFLSWLALSFKTAFAIFGISKVCHLLLKENFSLDIHIYFFALLFVFIFVTLNIIGIKEAVRFQIIMVVSLLLLMFFYFLFGVNSVKITRFEPFTNSGFIGLIATSGFVFVSYGGLLKAASIAEEVKNPKKNIPRALITSIIVTTLLYCLLLIVAVGVVEPTVLTNSLTPIADTARVFAGRWGYILITIAAMLAFVTTANAGILSASRFPLAMSKDNLIPSFISYQTQKKQTPLISIIITGAFLAVALLFDLEFMAKAGSTVILLTYMLSNVSIIIIRASRLQNYKPTFQVPFFPFFQIFTIIAFILLIIDMGIEPILTSIVFITMAMAVYSFYGRRKTKQEYALLHVLERITNRELTDYNLETELKEVVRERDELKLDDFDRLIQKAVCMNIDGHLSIDDFFSEIAKLLKNE